MSKKSDEMKLNDPYWWLGPAGVIFIVLLIIFAMARGTQPMRLDDLGAQARNKIKTKLGRRDAHERKAIWLGMQIAPLNRRERRQFGVKSNVRGVIVTDIDQGQGAEAGLNMGDIIIGVNGTKITDFDSFLWIAKQSKFSEGIFLDVLTNGIRRYVSMPFFFEGGPLTGPNTNHWQLGAPIYNPALGYGKLAAFTNNGPNQFQNMGTGFGTAQSGAGFGNAQNFIVCPNCGHSAVAGTAGPTFCPNCRIQMMPNQ